MRPSVIAFSGTLLFVVSATMLTGCRARPAACNAQYYLGMIYGKRKGTLEDQHVGTPQMPRGDSYDRLIKYLSELPAEREPAEKRALNYFLASNSCMATAARNFTDRISSVPALDIEDDEKVILRGKLEKKLFEHRLESASRIESMLDAISGEDIPGKQDYEDLMNEILSRIRPTTVTR